MRIQLQTSTLLGSEDIVVSAMVLMESITFIDRVSTMLLKEYAVKEAIVGDLREDLASTTLSTYLTTWKSKPHLDEDFIEKFKQTLAVSEQIQRSK
jgi:hypothetical protein